MSDEPQNTYQEEDPQPLDGPLTIKVGEVTLYYDFEELTLHQKELAVETYRFKIEQMKQMKQKNVGFEKVISTGGVEYKLRTLSFLFVTTDKNGAPREFKRSEADTTVLPLVRKIKGSENDEKVMAVLEDFFTGQNMPEILSGVQDISLLDLEDILQSGMSQMLSGASENSDGSQNQSESTNDSSNQTD